VAALHLDSRSAVAIVGRAVPGSSVGFFVGWAVALLRRYCNAGEAPPES